MKNFQLLVLFLITSNLAWAQTKIGGVVRDQDGQPMAFANVMFANSTEGTITNENGRFYLESKQTYEEVSFSFTGYTSVTVDLNKEDNLNLEVVLKDDAETLGAVQIFTGRTSKRDNPAVEILKKIWKNQRNNGTFQFEQYQYDKYEKLEFDLNSIDSSMINSRLFKDIGFIFEKIDTNAISGKNYLPIFINEAVSEVYGDNNLNKEKEILIGNQNSGFSDNHALTDFIKDLYVEYDIYANYLKFFNKSFISPLSRNGVNTYNYVLADSTFREDKWSYNIVYYPRRKNELTFKGNFWVNDTTWAVNRIRMEMTKSANINWVNDVYIEQEFDLVNDSTYVITKDHFMTNFALNRREDAKGVYGQRTTLYSNYKFDVEKPEEFYRNKRQSFNKEAFRRSQDFWEEKRLENLTEQERGIYDMLDTLKKTKTFKRFYNLGGIVASGYINFGVIDFGPLPHVVGYNEVEGIRTRVGGRTYFTPDDSWRVEGYTAYGFKDEKVKYGISAKWLIDPVSRLKISGGHRTDVEQLGNSLTHTSDVLGRSLASSSIFTVGSNKTLSHIKLTTLGLEISPVENFKIGIEGTYRSLLPASPEFNLDYYTDEDRTQTASKTRQAELAGIIEFMPNRKTTNYGVERIVINKRNYGHFFIKYTLGLQGVLNSDFKYNRLQMYYSQPLSIGGLGRLTPTIEAGKTFGKIPLSLLSPVPGNQTWFSMEGSFPLLEYYEFVTDTYASFHLEHNFNGRLFSYIPLIRDLKWREIIAFRGILGSISEENKTLNASLSHPVLYAPSENMYWSWSAGVGNILKFFRVDFHFRGNYKHENARKFGVTGTIQIDF